MTNRDYILKGVEYIESNLNEEISVFDVSKKIGYSLFHFTRLFQGVTGFSPKSYLLQRRLSESAKDLINTNKKVIEIAYDYQFGSPESFSRAFRKQFGMKPMEVRKGKSITSFPILNPLTEESMQRSRMAKEYEPEIVHLPEIILIGMVTFMKETQSGKIITELW